MLKMATRLDRLWILLDSGTTPVTRRAAALQIGEVQRLHPHELNNLLRKVCTYLTSKSWETRIATGQAVEAIVKNVKSWQPTYQPRTETPDSRESTPATDASTPELLSFDSFNIQRVLSHGTSLLSSTGEEYTLENDPEYEKMTPQEKAGFYRQQLMQRLGLTAQGKVFSTGIEKLIDDADLVITSSTRGSPQPKPSSEVKELSALQLSRMSARERNRAKRKAKQMARRNSRENEGTEKGGDIETPPPKKPRTTNVVVEQAGQSDKLLIDQVTDTDSVFEESEEWPLNWFCEEMFRNLFNPAWEVRHGAATALREVIKYHGDTAGLSVHTPPEKYSSATQSWLEDAAIRLLCVFALDRFADFVSDQVVVPVCATCAQALGTVVRTMEEERVGKVVEVLLSLSAQQEWEVRHASLMGIQHLLAARTDLSAMLLPCLSPSILQGLQDVDDDVRAVAASALLPVADQLHLIMPKEIPTLLAILWNSLTDLDDLSASTSSIMGLLCTLLSKNPTLYAGHTPEAMQLVPLVPRLWPFLSHTNTAVRRSCLQVLLTLLRSGGRQHKGEGREEGTGRDGEGGRNGVEEGEAMEVGGGEGGEREDTEGKGMEVGREQASEGGPQEGESSEKEAVMEVGPGKEGEEGDGEEGKGVPEEELGVSEGGRGGEEEGDERGGGGSGESPRMPWLSAILQGALCHLFQKFALEGDTSNTDLIHQVWEKVVAHCSSEELGSASAGLLMIWLCLAAAPSGGSVDPSLLTRDSQGTSSKYHLGGCLGVESLQQKEEAAFNARVNCARALGLLAAKLSSSHSTSSLSTVDSSPKADESKTSLPPSSSSSSFSFSSLSAPTSSSSQALAILAEGLRQMLVRTSATHRMVASLVIGFWGQCPSDLLDLLSSILTEQITYEEIMPFLVALQRDCHVLVVAFDKKGVKVSPGTPVSGYTAEFAAQLATKTFESSVQTIQLTATEKQEFETHRRNLLTALGHLQEELQRSQTRVHCCVAGALVILRSLPPKLNPIIRPLMDSVKVESDAVMQSLSAKWLSYLLDHCKDRSPTPNTKIIKNLCTFACCDPHTTPPVRPAPGPDVSPSSKKGSKGKTNSTPSMPTEEASSKGHSWRWDQGIITLAKQHEQLSSDRVPQGRGRPSAAVREALAAAAVQEKHKPQFYQRRGAVAALTAIAQHFGPHLLTTLPQLWSHITFPLHNLPAPPEEGTDPSDELVASAQSVVNSLQVLEIISPALHSSLKTQLLSLLPLLLSALCSPFTAVRHMAARCVAATSQVDLHQCMQFLVKDVVPYLGDTDSPVHRQGAMETTACILETAGLRALCYIVLLIMPVLGRLSDQRHEVRLMASRCFATLVTLMPLESGVNSPPEMPPDLAERRQSERRFLEQLLDISKLESYSVPVPIKADLRKYQQDGINWLAFLNKYNLHGILCDDMGLGKTLQSLCIIAGDHHYRDKEYKSTGRVDAAPLPSLVVCPPTLTGHWYYEVGKFCSRQDLSPLLYTGPPNTRARLQNLVPNHNLVIASYDIVRNDIKFFRSITWNYCILDEGHIIKNTTTKITKAVKQLRAHHRLILSGTPIQNNVLELWSLFDFLMPGFLGTEKQFAERFGKPILLSRDAKSSSKEQEAGALAMESLHRQVLPFLLRRMKEDVLQDLPPKIIQDYQCELSPLQVQLYEDFARSKAKKAVEDNLSEEEEEEETEEREGKRLEIGAATHIFQALQYLRKVCNHPSLVVTEDHPMFSKVQDYLKKTGTDLRDIRHATKLQALKQLLHDCGIGVEGEGEESLASAVGQHRILIFCQFKGILDIIENDLFKIHMPTVTYLRLDGSVPASSRFGIVHKFNSDPSVDVLLLTTHVGGLGLNLTGADTVIFFEHDWNPMKDLQAMDRAHRIGQKKVVNVYRLITKGTLEEKIMSLQKFKLNIANTVISQDNSSLQSMNTAELLDLFQLSDTPGNGKETNAASGKERKEGMKQILENLPTLWDEEQYKTEYDLSTFMQSLSAVKKD